MLDKIDWHEVFNRLHAKLERALKIGDSPYSVEQLAEAIERGRFKLFYTANSVLVCEMTQFPAYRTMGLFLAAGDMQECLELEVRACEWGRENGCAAATTVGRRGWLRVLESRGWKPSKNIMLTKELTDG